MLQPLDRGVNAQFKKALARFGPYESEDSHQRKAKLLMGAADAVQSSHTRRIIAGAWESSGLWPWDPARILGDQSLCVKVTEETPNPPERKRRGPSISGKLLTSDRMLEELTEAKIKSEKVKEEKDLKKPGKKLEKKEEKKLVQQKRPNSKRKPSGTQSKKKK